MTKIVVTMTTTTVRVSVVRVSVASSVTVAVEPEETVVVSVVNVLPEVLAPWASTAAPALFVVEEAAEVPGKDALLCGAVAEFVEVATDPVEMVEERLPLVPVVVLPSPSTPLPPVRSEEVVRAADMVEAVDIPSPLMPLPPVRSDEVVPEAIVEEEEDAESDASAAVVVVTDELTVELAGADD